MQHLVPLLCITNPGLRSGTPRAKERRRPPARKEILMPKRKKIILVVVGLVVFAALWYAFRPEKLFTNKRVDEPPPGQSSQ